MVTAIPTMSEVTLGAREAQVAVAVLVTATEQMSGAGREMLLTGPALALGLLAIQAAALQMAALLAQEQAQMQGPTAALAVEITREALQGLAPDLALAQAQGEALGEAALAAAG